MHSEKDPSGNVEAVIAYHERTKHRPDRYAAAPGYMDWANQPDPFRTYAGSQPMALPFPDLRETPRYDDLFSHAVAAAAMDAGFIGRLFYHSLALSAWKQAPQTQPWSLRINPSSGDLHPTEGYLISGAIPGLIDEPGVFHYTPYTHRLERRCRLSAALWQRLTHGLPAPCLLIGLTSIHWRESWKYGERAFRYCHHDVGHAIGAVVVAAHTLGWETRLLDGIADDDLDRLLGTRLQTGDDAEHADCLLVLYPEGAASASRPAPCAARDGWPARIADVEFIGTPNQLSRDHHPWPVIADVARAVRKPAAAGTGEAVAATAEALPEGLAPRPLSAERIIRQRRSAVRMDGRTFLDRSVFYQMLQRTLPGQFPFAVLPWPPRVSLALFVHRVVELPPGLYLFARNAAHEAALRRSLRSDFLWQRAEGCPRGLRVYRLLADDMRQAAKMIGCRQDIAADGAFALGMLAAFDSVLAADGAWRYPRLFWECGLLGQILYLEAEAAGIRATGIGCFFDDVMHELLGITNREWQSLYHFTVGGPVEDSRLKTIAPYAHLGEDRRRG